MKNLRKIETRDFLLLGKTRELRDFDIKKETFLGLLYLLVETTSDKSNLYLKQFIESMSDVIFIAQIKKYHKCA